MCSRAGRYKMRTGRNWEESGWTGQIFWASFLREPRALVACGTFGPNNV